MNIGKIIKQETKNWLKENYNIDDYYEIKGNVTEKMFTDFLYKNNDDFTKNIPWNVAPAARIKKIWEDNIKYGVVRDERGIDLIESIFMQNIIKIDIITELAGHTPYDPDEIYEEYIGYYINEQVDCIRVKYQDVNQLEIDFDNETGKGYKQKEYDSSKECHVEIHPYIKNLIIEEDLDELPDDELKKVLYNHFINLFLEYYVEDPKSGHAYITDYGYDALLKNYKLLTESKSYEEKLIILDRILNVVHQRSDMASWFVDGGSSALSNISGYETTEKPVEFNQYGSNIGQKKNNTTKV